MISRYSSQLTPVCLLHSEKRAKTILPFVSNMVFPTSPLNICVWKLEKENIKFTIKWRIMNRGKLINPVSN